MSTQPFRYLARALTACGLLFWAGCGHGAGTCSHAGHEHADHNHSHSSESAEAHAQGIEFPDHADHDDEHSHIGPNGNPLIVLGEHEYHAELTIDAALGTATVLLFDHCGRHPVAIDQGFVTINLVERGRPHHLRLAANPQPCDPPPTASRFCGNHPMLQDQQPMRGRINLVIGGKPYTGPIAQQHGAHTVVR